MTRAAVMAALVVLTRPASRNEGLAALLRDDGFDVACLPALALETVVHAPEQMMWPDGFDLVVFVSSHAAQSYLDCLQRWRPGSTWPAHVNVATVGYASARPIYQFGQVPIQHIFHPSPDQNQDSEALWEVLAPVLPRLKRVLIVRGQAGREWLGEQFECHGIDVSRLSLYRRVPAVWHENQAAVLARALPSEQATVFLLTSSESVDAVYANIQRLGTASHWAQCRFIVIHERMAARLQTVLRASGVNTRHPIQHCAPNDDAIRRAVHLSVSHA